MSLLPLRVAALLSTALLPGSPPLPDAPPETIATESDAAVEWHVDRERARRAAFVSRTPLEDFAGVTERIDGFLFLPEDGVVTGDAFPSSQLHFEVDLASLETGIRLRDRHMREEYLEVGRFPLATFTGSVDRIAEAGDDLRVTSSGTFAVHGVEHERSIECDARSAAPGYRVRCSFPVRLPDHDIEIPRLMFLKLAEEVRVDLDFHLRPVEER